MNTLTDADLADILAEVANEIDNGKAADGVRPALRRIAELLKGENGGD